MLLRPRYSHPVFPMGVGIKSKPNRRQNNALEPFSSCKLLLYPFVFRRRPVPRNCE